MLIDHHRLHRQRAKRIKGGFVGVTLIAYQVRVICHGSCLAGQLPAVRFDVAGTASSTVKLVRWLVVRSVADPASVAAKSGDALVEALEAGGHVVDQIDLAVESFEPCMSAEEHIGYENIGTDHPDPIVAGHIKLVCEAEGLAFVFPTGWTVPATLKGWMERTMLPQVGFVFNPTTRLLTPNLKVKHLAVVTTTDHGKRHRFTYGDPARRMINRSIRAMCRPRCRTTWLSLYDRSVATSADNESFIADVRSTFEAL